MNFENLINDLLKRNYKLNEQLAKGKTLENISKETDTSKADLNKELKKGIKAEKEHTSSNKKAKTIAKDHLIENPKYYTKLKKAGL